MRRFLRIYPPYLFVLLIQLLFGYYLKLPHFKNLSPSDVWEHLMLRAADDIYWAVPVEFKYYFLLPVVAFVLVVVLRKQLALAVIASIAAIGLISFVLWPPMRALYFPFSVGSYLPIFLLGSLTALIHSRLGETSEPKSVFRRTLLEITAVISLLAIFLLIPGFWILIAGRYAYLIPYPNREFVLFGVLWSLFIFSYLNGRGLVRRVLEIRLLRFIGIVSFSAYLLHLHVIGYITSAIDTWTAVEVLLCLLVTLLIAGISHLVIEKPFMRLGSRSHPIV
jgi:peptidoglycan/LPS O-acetylase OafA/YrhL